MLRTAALLLAVLPACRAPDPRQEELELLTRWMTGTFTSEEQARADPDHFFPTRLVMAPVWPERSDGPWLYVEQAAMRGVDRPYRQRVYRLVAQPNGVYRSDVYLLSGYPLRFVGRWGLPGIGPDDLQLREGCSIYLRRVDRNSFAGATQGRGCRSTLTDAAYATSEVTITKLGLKSWDRGFDAEDRQVWGAKKGPYDFRKRSDGVP